MQSWISLSEKLITKKCCVHFFLSCLVWVMKAIQTYSLFILRFPINILFEYLTQRFFNSIISRSIRPGVFLVKGVLKKRSKFIGEHPCWSVISIKRQPCRSMILIKLLCNFIEITLRHGCFPVNFLYIFRERFSKNTSWWLLLNITLVFILSWIRRDCCQL